MIVNCSLHQLKRVEKICRALSSNPLNTVYRCLANRPVSLNATCREKCSSRFNHHNNLSNHCKVATRFWPMDVGGGSHNVGPFRAFSSDILEPPAMYSTEAYASTSLGSPFEKITIQRNECGPEDVEFDILYCGICHTDIHITLNHTGSTKYPIVPGHELAGVVTKVGGNVTKYKVGDRVGVGCISESCLNCHSCDEGDEHQCESGMTGTYNGPIKHDLIKTNTGYTFGGYSRRTTLNQRFIIKIPDQYPLECAGPIFCAGITMFSPLKYFGAGNGGKRVGIAGIGGLGQMGIQLAAALGNEVTAISTNPTKEEKCKQLGAKHFVISTDEQSMKSGARSLDLILNTISASHRIKDYLPLLACNSTIVQLGIVMEEHSFPQRALMGKRAAIAGSSIGGIPETQECIDLCAAKNIRPDIEVITADRIDDVYRILGEKNDTVRRYVLDLVKSGNL